jgi:D-alanine-D-alanine ligase
VIKLEKESEPIPLYTIGITYNVKKGLQSDVEDEEAEYDSLDTVLAIKNTIEDLGCNVELLEADDYLFDRLKDTNLDMVFNIAEGRLGRGREAQVPSILNFFNIPFTGSDETTLCVALDKALCKRIIATAKVRTPKYQEISNISQKVNSKLKFPMIIKPNAEGSSKGITDVAVADNMDMLNSILNKNLQKYNQPMLIEEFIRGREFTIGILGNGGDVKVFSPMEISYKNDCSGYGIYSYNVKCNYKDYIEYICPARINGCIADKMTHAALKIYNTLKCRDFSRIDFRLAQDGTIYFIEINPLPGLTPGYSDYPMLASMCGMDYKSLIKGILNSALKRYNMRGL